MFRLLKHRRTKQLGVITLSMLFLSICILFLGSAVNAASNKPGISSIEKTDNKIIVKGNGPANQDISVQVVSGKRVLAKVSNEGTYQLDLDKETAPYGYLRLYSVSKKFFGNNYKILQDKKYYSLFDESAGLTDKPMQAVITTVTKKGDTYQIEGYYLPKTQIVIKQNDRSIKKAKTDKNGLFKVSKVKLNNPADTLSLDTRTKKGWFSYSEAPISNKLYFNDKTSTFTSVRPVLPKVSFDDFYKWLTTDRQDALLKNIGNPYQIIMATCGAMDRNFGNTWVSCMQEGYKNYLKPDVFTNDKWQGDYSTMMGHINNAITQERLYGTGSKTDQWKKNTSDAKTIYERLAITN